MAAHRLFEKRAGTFRDEVAVFQTDGLLVQPRIPDDGRRDLGIIGFDDTDAIRSQVLMGDLKGRGIRNGLDHLRIEQAESFSAAENFLLHLGAKISCLATEHHDGLSVTSDMNPVKQWTVLSCPRRVLKNSRRRPPLDEALRAGRSHRSEAQRTAWQTPVRTGDRSAGEKVYDSPLRSLRLIAQLF